MIVPELLTRVLPAPAVLVAMGAQPEGGGPFWVQLAPFALILGIFYFVILAPMRKRQKKVSEFQDALKVGDKVVTTGGLYGVVTRLGDKALQIQIADRVRVEVSRSAIVGYQGQDPVVPESTNT